jgi:hypothetical protein
MEKAKSDIARPDPLALRVTLWHFEWKRLYLRNYIVKREGRLGRPPYGLEV